MTRARLPFLAAVLLLSSAAVQAQAPLRVEVAASVGWRTGAALLDSGDGGTYDVEASSSWGVVADVSLGSPGLFGELAWTRQASRISFDDAFGPGRSDVTLDSFLVGGQWVSTPREPIRPFLAAHVGITRIEVPGSSVSHFTASLSGGVKLMASDAFGVRLEAGRSRSSRVARRPGCAAGRAARSASRAGGRSRRTFPEESSSRSETGAG